MPKRCCPLSCAVGTCYFPQRKLLVYMLFWGIFYSYVMRITFHISLLYLRDSPSEEEAQIPEEECCDCPFAYVPYQTWKSYADEWNEYIVGLLLASFFIGYFIAQIVCIWMSKVKPRIPLGILVLLQSAFFLAIPLCIGVTWILVAVLRLLQGFCAGFIFYFSCSLSSEWIPVKDRGVTNIVLFSASHLGTIVGSFLTVIVNDMTEDWSMIYYILGGLSLLWSIFFFIICHNSFRDHPYILQREYDYLNSEIAEYVQPKLSFSKVLKSKAVWGLIFATIGHDFCFYLYFNYVFWFYYNWKFNFEDMSSAVALSYTLLYIACFLFAMVRVCCDAAKRCRINCSRKCFTTIGLLIPPLFMVALPFTDCRSVIPFIMFSFALFFMGAYYSGVPLNIFDIAPIYAEKVAAILNIFGTFQGVTSAMAAAAFLANFGPIDAWMYIFLTNLGICIVCWIIYLIIARGERQAWDMEAEYLLDSKRVRTVKR